jgi:hypothetical protein
MENCFVMTNIEGDTQLALVACDCPDCENTTLTVEKRRRKGGKRVSLTLDRNALGMLRENIDAALAFHDGKQPGGRGHAEGQPKPR